MPEKGIRTPDLRTLGIVLAPDSSRATLLKSNPYTGERTPLMEKIDLSLPKDFFMTDFDELVLNQLHNSANRFQVMDAIQTEFTTRGINAEVTITAIDDYLGALRGITRRIDGKAELSFPAIRAGYNALRMLENDEFPDYKRYLQYVTATMLANGESGLAAAEALHIGRPTAIVDMMILDLSEVAPEELNGVIEQCIDRYFSQYKSTMSFDDFLRDFKAGFVLAKTPSTSNSRFHRLINESVSRLWLEKLQQDSSLFKSEDMEYVLEALDIFIRSFDVPRPGRHGKRLEMGEVNEMMHRRYMAGCNVIGSVVINTVMGLYVDGASVPEMIDRGLEHVQAY